MGHVTRILEIQGQKWATSHAYFPQSLQSAHLAILSPFSPYCRTAEPRHNQSTEVSFSLFSFFFISFDFLWYVMRRRDTVTHKYNCFLFIYLFLVYGLLGC
jgi:hypothetical protein